MNAQQLYREGRLDEAVRALGAELRDDPTDVRRRTFLFELLVFSGEFDRAEKQLDILADSGKEAGMGALVYRAALHAERLRRAMFESGAFPSSPAEPVRATVNGADAGVLADADPRIGPRLEVFAAGAYLWLPFAHIASVRMEPPRRLRDLIWIPAKVRTGPQCKDLDLGEVLLPALTPMAFRHPDSAVRLGRSTEWEEADGELRPAGQKLLLAEGEEIPILEVRSLDFPCATTC
jgi:type VI secretion system protein ImpE